MRVVNKVILRVDEETNQSHGRMTMKTNHLGINDEHNDFYRGSLLASKLVLVVAIHSLGGSCANWLHTPNPQ